MDLNSLDPELQAKVRACKSTDDLIALAEEEGIELSLDQVDAAAGGACWDECNIFIDSSDYPNV